MHHQIFYKKKTKWPRVDLNTFHSFLLSRRWMNRWDGREHIEWLTSIWLLSSREKKHVYVYMYLCVCVCIHIDIFLLYVSSEVKVTQSCLTLCDPHGLYSPWNSPGQNTGVGSLSLLQGIFPTQGSNPGLLHCKWILYQLSHHGSMYRCIEIDIFLF